MQRAWRCNLSRDLAAYAAYVPTDTRKTTGTIVEQVQERQKIVVDLPLLNLINFKACKPVCFQGMRMIGREGAR